MDSTIYKWTNKNPLKNKNWKEAEVYKDQNYVFNKILIIEEDENTIIKFI